MAQLLRSVLPLFAALALAPAASALPVATLVLDPLRSFVEREGQPGGDPPLESLSGALTLEVGALPLVANTTLALHELSLTSAGGLSIALDPEIATAGLGVLYSDGSFLIPTLFLRITSGAEVRDLAFTDVTGTLVFAGPSSIAGARAGSDFDADPLQPGLGRVEIVAVPEPAALLFVSAGLAALAAQRARREIVP